MSITNSSTPSIDRDYFDPIELRQQFSDRELFVSKVQEKLAQLGPLPILMFFGVGGAGKTYLMRFLQQEFAYKWGNQTKGFPHAFLSFRYGHTSMNPQEALWQARGQLVRCSKQITFPRFDLLWGRLWERSNNMHIKQNPILLPEEISWLSELLQSAEGIPYVGDFAKLINLGSKITQRVQHEFAIRRVLSWFRDKVEVPKGMGWKAALKVMDIAEILALLPIAFAADLSDSAISLSEPYNRILLFIDNYETLQGQIGESYGQESTNFIQTLAEELSAWFPPNNECYCRRE